MYLNILHKLQKTGVKLLAVSKTKSADTIQHFYNIGHRDFGENKVQELVQKHSELPKDIRWHMIGHLQRNKVKLIIPFIHLIHSVDSLRLAEKINIEAAKVNKVVDILIQIEISDEISKFGWNYNDLILHTTELYALKNIRIKGFMGMAKNTTNETEIQQEFQLIKNHFHSFQTLVNQECFDELSIGMSSDYHIAIKEGATIVRIGSLIFGNRK